MTQVADITFSPDDDGWYATVWSPDGAPRASVQMPEDNQTFSTRGQLIQALRSRYGPHLRIRDNT